MAAIGKPKVRGPRKPVAKGAIVAFKTLIKHPMESGLRKNKESGETIPAHFIQEVKAEYMGKEILKAEWTGSISKNPFFSFNVKAEAAGDVKVTWTDNQGGSWSAASKLQVA